MKIKAYKADRMNYTQFDREENNSFFAKYGIEFSHRIDECELIISRFYHVLENYAKYHENKKKYLLWTHEPRIDTHLKPLDYCENVPINIMNVYTGDIFTNNYLYSSCLKQILTPSANLDFTKSKHKKIAVIASYNEHYFSQVVEDGRNLDLCELRAEIALLGHSLGKVDIYGRGWLNDISLEDSRFQLKSNEQFWGDRKLDILQQYHFNLCFENSTINYYCSEKIWHSIMTGALPIYYSKGNAIYEDFSEHSFLDYCDFNTPQELFDYIDKMEIDEYNERMNRCIATANRVFNTRGYDTAVAQLLYNTVSKIQTITGYKQTEEDLVESTTSISLSSLKRNIALNKPAQQSSTCQYSKPNDAQGAVCGIKGGRYNFHTDHEVNPWWQLDLEQISELGKVIIYNRLDCCSERASSLKLFTSPNGRFWEQVYQNNPQNIFGGIDGNPLEISLKGKQARYLRIQLDGVAPLHLDQVEIYAA